MNITSLFAGAALAAGLAGAASAATEVWEFDATLTQGTLFCGDFVGLEDSCPSEFGVADAPSSLDDLMLGLEIGQTYSGRIELEWSSDDVPADLIAASCSLNGKDCLFSTDLLSRPGPLGVSSGVLDFSDTGVVASSFSFAPGEARYLFGTDYIFDEDDTLHYYANVRFDLTNVSYSDGTTVVPLPASALILLTSLMGLFWLRRRRA